LICDSQKYKVLAGSTLAANSRGIKRFLTPTKKPRLAASISNRFDIRGDCHVLPQGVAHQLRVCTPHAARLGVKNRLMPRELAVSVLSALGVYLAPLTGLLSLSIILDSDGAQDPINKLELWQHRVNNPTTDGQHQQVHRSIGCGFQ
jgi:hypothetical protein